MTYKLTDCKRGDRVRIEAIDAGRGVRINLMGMGIDVGHEIELLQRSPLRGPLLVKDGDTEVAIGYGMAEKIVVTREA